jgi:hypothetical protein
MGLPRVAVNILLHIASEDRFKGSIATLGRQHIYLNEAELRSLAKARQVELSLAPVDLHRDPILRDRGYVSDDSLYELLGFEQSVRIDQSDYEAANVQLDLNQQFTPETLQSAFDVVLDSGTIEHVFEIGQAMRHCLAMTRTGGRIIHLTPSSNSVNHGLYSVSPTLYADFYSASGCQIEKLWLCRVSRNVERGTWTAYDCLHSDRNWLPLGRLDGAIWFTLAVIRKLPNTQAVVPQQSFYLNTWKSSEQRAGAVTDSGQFAEEPANSRAGRLLSWSASLPLLHRVAKLAVVNWRKLINGLRERRRGRIPFPSVGKF